MESDSRQGLENHVCSAAPVSKEIRRESAAYRPVSDSAAQADCYSKPERPNAVDYATGLPIEIGNELVSRFQLPFAACVYVRSSIHMYVSSASARTAAVLPQPEMGSTTSHSGSFLRDHRATAGHRESFPGANERTVLGHRNVNQRCPGSLSRNDKTSLEDLHYQESPCPIEKGVRISPDSPPRPPPPPPSPRTPQLR